MSSFSENTDKTDFGIKNGAFYFFPMLYKIFLAPDLVE